MQNASKQQVGSSKFKGITPYLRTDAVISVTVEIVALVAVTFVHEIMQIEATLFTRSPIFALTCNII